MKNPFSPHLRGLAAAFLAVLLLTGGNVALFGAGAPDLARVMEGPSGSHPFGFDSLGRDLFWRSLEGLWSSFILGASAGAIAAVLGLALGAAAGLRGGLLDAALMRVIDILEALPNLLMAAVLLLFWRIVAPDETVATQFAGLALALGLTGWFDLARQMRALTLRERSLPYIEAAVAIGAPRLRLVRRHLWPNIRSSLVLLMLLQIPGFMLFEATLSFFGLGLRSPQTSLGQILLEGWKLMTYSSHVILGPTLLLFLALLSFQILIGGRRGFRPRSTEAPASRQRPAPTSLPPTA